MKQLGAIAESLDPGSPEREWLQEFMIGRARQADPALAEGLAAGLRDMEAAQFIKDRAEEIGDLDAVLSSSEATPAKKIAAFKRRFDIWLELGMADDGRTWAETKGIRSLPFSLQNEGARYVIDRLNPEPVITKPEAVPAVGPSSKRRLLWAVALGVLVLVGLGYEEAPNWPMIVGVGGGVLWLGWSLVLFGIQSIAAAIKRGLEDRK